MYAEDTIIYFAEPQPAAGVPNTPEDQDRAFSREVAQLMSATDQDVTRIPNPDWVRVFGIYWHIKRLIGAYAWTQHWAELKEHIATHATWTDFDLDNQRLELWAWFTKAMNWRRDEYRRRNGEGARRWKQTKSDPAKHAKVKADNAASARRARQRKRRAVERRLPEDRPWESPADPWEASP